MLLRPADQAIELRGVALGHMSVLSLPETDYVRCLLVCSNFGSGKA
jgi:hypothetical protein